VQAHRHRAMHQVHISIGLKAIGLMSVVQHPEIQNCHHNSYFLARCNRWAIPTCSKDIPCVDRQQPGTKCMGTSLRQASIASTGCMTAFPVSHQHQGLRRPTGVFLLRCGHTRTILINNAVAPQLSEPYCKEILPKQSYWHNVTASRAVC